MAYKKTLKEKIKILLASVAFAAFFLFILRPVLASSPYVLPYPSAMPGSSVYKLHQLYENLSQYKYFGDFGKFKYNLRYSDKYLVEAKTLFEYKQYLLGYQAIEKSNNYFEQIEPALRAASAGGKNISEKKTTFHQARDKHVEILQLMRLNAPATFNWQPERSNSTVLSIHELIDKSIELRNDR